MSAISSRPPFHKVGDTYVNPNLVMFVRPEGTGCRIQCVDGYWLDFPEVSPDVVARILKGF